MASDATLDHDRETRECPFPDCEWEHEFDGDAFGSQIDADFQAELHYEREHAGEVRVTVTLEMTQRLGDRDPAAVSQRALERFEDKQLGGFEAAYACAEVTAEPDDHSVLADDD